MVEVVRAKRVLFSSAFLKMPGISQYYFSTNQTCWVRSHEVSGSCPHGVSGFCPAPWATLTWIDDPFDCDRCRLTLQFFWRRRFDSGSRELSSRSYLAVSQIPSSKRTFAHEYDQFLDSQSKNHGLGIPFVHFGLTWLKYEILLLLWVCNYEVKTGWLHQKAKKY